MGLPKAFRLAIGPFLAALGVLAAVSRIAGVGAQTYHPRGPDVCALIAVQEAQIGKSKFPIAAYETLGFLTFGCAEAKILVMHGDTRADGACELYSSAADAFAVAAKLKQANGGTYAEGPDREKKTASWAKVALSDYYFASEGYLAATFSCGYGTTKSQVANKHEGEMIQAILDLENR